MSFIFGNLAVALMMLLALLARACAKPFSLAGGEYFVPNLSGMWQSPRSGLF